MNAVSILSLEPWVCDVADCLLCERVLPAGTACHESPTPEGGALRYRLCPACASATVYATLMGGAVQQRLEAQMLARIRLIGFEMAMQANLMARAETGVLQ